ncbi:MAG: energy transducer TonB [Terracidiphilus sp.]
MSVTYYPERINFSLLPEPESRSASFITSTVINGIILALSIYFGLTVKHVVDTHKYEQTQLIVPDTPPKPKAKVPPSPPPQDLPKLPEVKLDAPRITVPKPKPEPKLPDVKMEAKVALPALKPARTSVILAPQPKTALAPAAMPAQDSSVKPSTKPVHLGDTFGVTPNPNARGPATIAAIGNPYGGMKGPAIAPHGVPGSTGIGDGIKFGNNGGRPGGKVASASIPDAAKAAPSGNVGKVASVGISTAPTAVVTVPRVVAEPIITEVEVLSKPEPQYTSEARQLKVHGDVVLRVTFTASGQVVVQGLVHGLGHGLDEEARRVAEGIRFRPATRNGQAVDVTTNIIVTFQLA